MPKSMEQGPQKPVTSMLTQSKGQKTIAFQSEDSRNLMRNLASSCLIRPHAFMGVHGVPRSPKASTLRLSHLVSSEPSRHVHCTLGPAILCLASSFIFQTSWYWMNKLSNLLLTRGWPLLEVIQYLRFLTSLNYLKVVLNSGVKRCLTTFPKHI